jgi:hypothetical protein
MSNDNTLTETPLREQLTVDGRSVDREEFNRIREEVSADPTRKLKEVTPGEWRTLQLLND